MATLRRDAIVDGYKSHVSKLFDNLSLGIFSASDEMQVKNFVTNFHRGIAAADRGLLELVP